MMNTPNGQQIANKSQAAHSFIQIVRDNGDWFEPRDIVKLVVKSRQRAESQLVKAKRGRYEVVACAPMLTGYGRCLEVSLREIRSA